MNTSARIAIACIGGGLVSAAVVLQAADIAARLPKVSPAAAMAGAQLLRIALILLGVVLIRLASAPAAWFSHAGLDHRSTGLRVGPKGWHPDNRTIMWAPLVAILCLGALLRIYKLQSGLWVDEILTLVKYMRSPLWDNLYLYHSANQHVLNSLLGHLCVQIFGEHIWSIRLPAVLFGIGGLWALYYFARTVTGERQALAATALLAVSYHHVWFSQNARGYSAMLFWVFLGMGALLRAIGRNRNRDWIIYAVSMLLGVWSILNTVFIVVSHIPAYLWACRNRPGAGATRAPITRRLFFSQVMVGLSCMVVYSLALPSIIDYYAPAAFGPSVQGTQELTVAAPRTVNHIYAYHFGASLLSGLSTGLGPLGLPAMVIALMLTVAGLSSYFRQSRLLVAMMVLPPLFNAGAVTFLHFHPLPRSFLYLLPFGLLLLVRGAAIFSNRIAASFGRARTAVGYWAAVLLIGCMLAASSLVLQRNYQYPKQDYDAALAYVNAHAQASDITCALGSAAYVFREYYALDLCFPESLQELAAAQARHSRIWIIYTLRRNLQANSPAIFNNLMHSTKPVATFPGTLGDGDLHVRLGRLK